MTLEERVSELERFTRAISEVQNDKADRDLHNTIPPYIKERYVNGTEGYTIWSDGYCEQWGKTVAGTDGMSNIAFLKEFNSVPQVYVNRIWRPGGDPGDTVSDRRQLTISPPTLNGFSMWINGWGSIDIFWKASGYLAEGEY